MKQYKVHFEKTDIIFTDPCYFVKDDDIWDKYFEDFAMNKSLDKLGCSTGVCIDVGDVVPDILVDEDSGCYIKAKLSHDLNNLEKLELVCWVVSYLRISWPIIQISQKIWPDIQIALCW